MPRGAGWQPGANHRVLTNLIYEPAAHHRGLRHALQGAQCGRHAVRPCALKPRRLSLPLQAQMQQGILLCCSIILHSRELKAESKNAL